MATSNMVVTLLTASILPENTCNEHFNYMYIIYNVKTRLFNYTQTTNLKKIMIYE